MARVPVTSRVVAHIAPEPIPGVRRTGAGTAESEGLLVAEAKGQEARAMRQFSDTIGQLGETALSIVEVERRRADEVAVMEAENSLSAWTQSRLYDPEKGALNVRGKAAMGLPEQVTSEFDAQADSIAGTLSSPRQQQAFAKVRLQHLANLDLTLQRHTFQQIDAYETEESAAKVANSRTNAITAADDLAQPTRAGDAAQFRTVALQRIVSEVQAGVDTIKANGAHLGLGPEKVQEQVELFTTNTHAGIVERLLANHQVKAARAYFEEMKADGQIKGPALAKIEDALKAGTLEKEVQTRGDELLRQFPDDLTKQREAAKTIDDPDVRKGVLAQLEHEYTVRETQKRDAHEKLTLQATNILEETGRYLAIPQAIRRELTSGERSSLLALERSKAEGVPVKTDPAVYYQVVQMAYSPNPELRDEFLKLPLMQFAGSLSKGDLMQVMDAQARMRQGDERAARALLVDANAQNRMVDEALMRMGMDPTPPQAGTKDFDQAKTDRVVAFRRQVRERVADIENRTGQKATDEQVQKVVDELRAPMGPATKTGGFLGFGGTTTQHYEFERTPGALATTIADVPPAKRQRIEAALKARGDAVTDTNILFWYRLMEIAPVATRSGKD